MKLWQKHLFSEYFFPLEKKLLGKQQGNAKKMFSFFSEKNIRLDMKPTKQREILQPVFVAWGNVLNT